MRCIAGSDSVKAVLTAWFGMADETRWLVILGFDSDIDRVLGPFLTESDAILAKNVAEQMEFKDSGETWGGGDTWVSVERRETITL